MHDVCYTVRCGALLRHRHQSARAHMCGCVCGWGWESVCARQPGSSKSTLRARARWYARNIHTITPLRFRNGPVAGPGGRWVGGVVVGCRAAQAQSQNLSLCRSLTMQSTHNRMFNKGPVFLPPSILYCSTSLAQKRSLICMHLQISHIYSGTNLGFYAARCAHSRQYSACARVFIYRVQCGPVLVLLGVLKSGCLYKKYLN